MRTLWLAINARFTHSNPAVRSMIAWCQKHVPKADLPEMLFLESNINQDKDALLVKIMDQQPDVCLISCYIWNITYIKSLLSDLRQLKPDLLIILGGPEVAYTPEESLADMSEIDLIELGEGERVNELLLPFLQRLTPGKNWRSLARQAIQEHAAELPGLAFTHTDGNMVNTGTLPPIDLNELPFIYQDNFQSLDHRYIYYESSRGCPFHCAYCLSAADHLLRFRQLDLVGQELDRFREAEVPLVKFIDRSFNAQPERARKIWKKLIDDTRRDLDDPIVRTKYQSYLEGRRKYPPYTRFHFEIEALLLEPEDLALLATAPKDLFQLEIGIQSFNPEVLRQVSRSPQTAPILNATRQLVSQDNMHIHVDLIWGLPGQDLASIARSFRVILTSNADKIQLGFLKVLKGTPLWQRFRHELQPYIWQQAAPYTILQTPLLSYRDLVSLHHLEAVFDRFWDKHLFATSLHVLGQLNQARAAQDQARTGSIKAELTGEEAAFDAFQFFRQLGEYFYTHGLFDRSLSQEEFFIRLSRAYQYLGYPSHHPLYQALIRDYLKRPDGSWELWEKMQKKYT